MANYESENKFLLEVDKMREEIKDKFSRFRELLQKRESSLLSELDKFEASYRGEGPREQIAQLDQMIKTLKSSGHHEKDLKFFEESVAPLNARRRELEASLKTAKDRLKVVVLEWDRDIERRLSELGEIRVIGPNDYKKMGEHVKSACKHKPNESVEVGIFRSPRSIAIDPQSNNIYVCDFVNNRVQVFDKSINYLFHFSERMDTPHHICVYDNTVYVTQKYANYMTVYSLEGDFLNSVGKKGEGKLEFLSPSGVAVSKMNNLIYVCEFDNNRIQCLNMDLTFKSFIPSVYHPRDIRITKNTTIVILKGGHHCIILFNKSHEFLREIIRCGEGMLLNKPLYFCIDDHDNIIMTDHFSHCITIFSIGGTFIHKFGEEGNNRGELIKPAGIALTADNRIIVISQNPNHCIQLF